MPLRISPPLARSTLCGGALRGAVAHLVAPRLWVEGDFGGAPEARNFRADRQMGRYVVHLTMPPRSGPCITPYSALASDCEEQHLAELHQVAALSILALVAEPRLLGLLIPA